MKNLGKIVVGLLVLQSAIYASVVASVDFSKVSIGEMVTYSLKVSDATIDRPMIDSLCGTNIVATSSQTNIEMLNGSYTRTKILNYKFMPQKTCTIGPITLNVDGKKEQTQTIEIEVKPATKDVNADFVIDLKTLKTDVFVGEPFEVEMLVKQKYNAQALDSKFIAPKMDGFWVSGEPKQEKYDDGTFVVTKLTYRLSAQREGDLNIAPAQLAVARRSAMRDRWGAFMQDVKWKSYFSNELKIHAKPIPQGAKFIGYFTITAKVDKTVVNPNEAVNVTVEVSGKGNLEDIQKFKPYIADVSVFDEKPLITAVKFSEKIALVGDNDFTVPAFTLKFYNPTTKTLQTIATQEIKIKVNGAKPKQELKIKRDVSAEVKPVAVAQKTLPLIEIAFVFIFGLVVGLLLMFFKPWEQLKREKAFDIKDEKKLLVKLMPYKEDDVNVQMIVDILEHNIYSKDRKQIDKKLLKEVIKRYDIR
jgi:hypothetical protein